jgi:hypothetical protein
MDAPVDADDDRVDVDAAFNVVCTTLQPSTSNASAYRRAVLALRQPLLECELDTFIREGSTSDATLLAHVQRLAWKPLDAVINAWNEVAGGAFGQQESGVAVLRAIMDLLSAFFAWVARHHHNGNLAQRAEYLALNYILDRRRTKALKSIYYHLSSGDRARGVGALTFLTSLASISSRVTGKIVQTFDFNLKALSTLAMPSMKHPPPKEWCLTVKDGSLFLSPRRPARAAFLGFVITILQRANAFTLPEVLNSEGLMHSALRYLSKDPQSSQLKVLTVLHSRTVSQTAQWNDYALGQLARIAGEPHNPAADVAEKLLNVAASALLTCTGARSAAAMLKLLVDRMDYGRSPRHWNVMKAVLELDATVALEFYRRFNVQGDPAASPQRWVTYVGVLNVALERIGRAFEEDRLRGGVLINKLTLQKIPKSILSPALQQKNRLVRYMAVCYICHYLKAVTGALASAARVHEASVSTQSLGKTLPDVQLLISQLSEKTSNIHSLSLPRMMTLKALRLYVQWVPMNTFVNGPMDLEHTIAGMDLANLHSVHHLQIVRLLITLDSACSTTAGYAYGMRGKAFSQILSVLLPQMISSQPRWRRKAMEGVANVIKAWLCTRLEHSGVLGRNAPRCEAFVWIHGLETKLESASCSAVSRFLDTAVMHTCKRPDEAFMVGLHSSSKGLNSASLLAACVAKHAVRVATSDKMVEQEALDVVRYATSALTQILLMLCDNTSLVMTTATVLEHCIEEINAQENRPMSAAMASRFRALGVVCRHIIAVYGEHSEQAITVKSVEQWHGELALLLGVNAKSFGDVVEQYFKSVLQKGGLAADHLLLLIRQALFLINVNRRTALCQELKVEEACAAAVSMAIRHDSMSSDRIEEIVSMCCSSTTFLHAALKVEGVVAQSALVAVMKKAMDLDHEKGSILQNVVTAVSVAVEYCLSEAAHASMPNPEFVDTMIEVALNCGDEEVERNLLLRLLTVGRDLGGFVECNKFSIISRTWSYLLLRPALVSLKNKTMSNIDLDPDIPYKLIFAAVDNLVNDLVKGSLIDGADIFSSELGHNELLRKSWCRFSFSLLSFWMERHVLTASSKPDGAEVEETWSRLGQSTYRQLIRLQAKKKSDHWLWMSGEERQLMACLKEALKVWDPSLSSAEVLHDVPKVASEGMLDVILEHTCTNTSFTGILLEESSVDDASLVDVLKRIRKAIKAIFSTSRAQEGNVLDTEKALKAFAPSNLDGLISFLAALPLDIKLGYSGNPKHKSVSVALKDVANTTLAILENLFLQSRQLLPDLFSLKTLCRVLTALLPSSPQDEPSFSDKSFDKSSQKRNHLSKTAAKLFEMVTFHPQFLIAMQSRGSQAYDLRRKVLCSLLETLLRIQAAFAVSTDGDRTTKVVERALLPILMASYGGTMSEVDVTVWSLAQYINLRCSNNLCTSATAKVEALLSGEIASKTCFAWGPAALALTNANAKSHAQDQDRETVLISTLYNHWPVDAALCAVTVKQWLRPGDQRSYDPRFLLPFCMNALQRGIVEPRTVVMQGLAGIALRALSEDADVSLRGMGYQVLGLLSQTLSSLDQTPNRGDFREAKDVVSVLHWIQRSIPSPFARIPVPHALYFAQALAIACNPGHPLYLVLARSRLSGINSNNCCLSTASLPPLLLRRRITEGPPGLGRTNRERHQGRRDFEIWATGVLTAGLYSAQDAWLYRRGGVFETAMALYDDRCTSCDLDAATEHLKLVCAGTKVPRVARDVSQRVGVIGWLASIAIQRLQDERAHQTVYLLHVHLAVDALLSMTTLKAVVGQAPEYSKHAIEDYVTVLPHLARTVSTAKGFYSSGVGGQSLQQSIANNVVSLVEFALKTCHLLDSPTAVENELRQSLTCFPRFLTKVCGVEDVV